MAVVQEKRQEKREHDRHQPPRNNLSFLIMPSQFVSYGLWLEHDSGAGGGSQRPDNKTLSTFPSRPLATISSA